ncbi:MAG: murein biosynthesis integral membrane protein MurJ, partial [Dehalococcoidia bacterium]|nr:murein biosynthesis integral membrane protein MurJ [Dehalococcoidia bacterium]
KNTITPVLVGVMGVCVYLIVGLSLIGPLGMPGLALANSAQLISHALVMVILLWRAIGGLGGLGIGVTAIKSLLAAAIMGVICSALIPIFRPIIGDSSLVGLALNLVIVGTIGAASYVLVLVVLRTEEIGQGWASVRERFKGEKGSFS